jgi:hypothetical protein
MGEKRSRYGRGPGWEGATRCAGQASSVQRPVNFRWFLANTRYEQLLQHGQACGCNEGAETHGCIETSEDFDSFDQRAIGQASMDALHER